MGILNGSSIHVRIEELGGFTLKPKSEADMKAFQSIVMQMKNQKLQGYVIHFITDYDRAEINWCSEIFFEKIIE